MNEEYVQLQQKGRDLYGRVANQALAGFQLIEEMLKGYIELHLDLVRALIAGRLHFDFRRDDYQEAALGRLVQVFSKLCANKSLVSELRAVVKRRDHIAHQALLKLYEEDISPAQYSQLIDELHRDMHRNSELMGKIIREVDALKACAS